MKIVNAMDNRSFQQVCVIGAEALVEMTKEFERRGLDPGHVGNALIVALAAVLKTGEVTKERLMEQIEVCSKLWIEDGDGSFVLRPLTIERERSSEN